MTSSRLLPAERRAPLRPAPTTSWAWRLRVLGRSWLRAHRGRMVLPAIVLVPPVGLALLWTRSGRVLRTRHGVTSAAVLWLLVVVVVLLAGPTGTWLRSHPSGHDLAVPVGELTSAAPAVVNAPRSPVPVAPSTSPAPTPVASTAAAPPAAAPAAAAPAAAPVAPPRPVRSSRAVLPAPTTLPAPVTPPTLPVPLPTRGQPVPPPVVPVARVFGPCPTVGASGVTRAGWPLICTDTTRWGAIWLPKG